MEEISINDILQLIKKNIIILLVAAICGGLLGFFWTQFAVDPEYTATGSIYVKSDAEGSQTANEIIYSQYLVNTYCRIIKDSRTIHGDDVTSLQTKYPDLTVKQIGRMLNSTVADSDEILTITVTSTDSELAVDVCNTVLTIVPAELIRITKAGSVEVINVAHADYVVASHPVMRNAALCAMVAIVIAFVVIFIGKMMDNKIFSAEVHCLGKRIRIILAVDLGFGFGNFRHGCFLSL